MSEGEVMGMSKIKTYFFKAYRKNYNKLFVRMIKLGRRRFNLTSDVSEFREDKLMRILMFCWAYLLPTPDDLEGRE